MSYSVDECVRDTAKRLEAMRLVAELYPDAYLSRDRWHTWGLKPEDCDSVTIEIDGERVFLLLYKMIGTVPVFPSCSNGRCSLWSVLNKVQQVPELMTALFGTRRKL